MSNFVKFLKQTKALSLWRKFRDQLEDQRENRQLIGEDRYGNRYYQYYSHFGLPIRRQVRFKNDIDFVMRDLVYYQWLHHQVFDPPTEQQKTQYYLQQQIRYKNALEQDRKQDLQMLEFRRRRQQLALRDKATKELQSQLKQQQKIGSLKSKRPEIEQEQNKQKKVE